MWNIKIIIFNNFIFQIIFQILWLKNYFKLISKSLFIYEKEFWDDIILNVGDKNIKLIRLLIN